MDSSDKLVFVPASEINNKLGGVVIKIKSHRARENAVRLLGGMKGLKSIRWVLYAQHAAAEGYYLISAMDVETLKKETSRWISSVSFPKKVPADLDFSSGGIFG